MPIRRTYKPGDYLVKCDRTGFTRYASQTKKEWQGLRVWKRTFWQRHPQDFVRGLKDDQTVPDARPKGVAEYIGPLTTELTADASAGDTTITVTSSARFEGGDRVLIGLDNNEMFNTLIQTIPDATSLTLTVALPWSAASGKIVVNRSAVSPSDVSAS